MIQAVARLEISVEPPKFAQSIHGLLFGAVYRFSDAHAFPLMFENALFVKI